MVLGNDGKFGIMNTLIISYYIPYEFFLNLNLAFFKHGTIFCVVLKISLFLVY